MMKNIKFKYWIAITGFIAPWLIFVTATYYPSAVLLEKIMSLIKIIGAILSLPSLMVASILFKVPIFLGGDISDTVIVALINSALYFLLLGYTIENIRNKKLISLSVVLLLAFFGLAILPIIYILKIGSDLGGL